MFQNQLLFSQSSVTLEIIGLPDYSKDEKKDQISIISQWKLIIINKPLIEGNIDHLSSIMEAFYNYSNLLMNNEIAFYESNLIDIKAVNFYTHSILLKSSRPDVKPLNIKIGNSVLSDIINCFEQFNSSNNVRKVELNVLNNVPRKSFLNSKNKDKVLSTLLPPLISLCSLFLVSSTLVFIYNFEDDKGNNAFINSKIIPYSIKFTNKLL